MFTRHHLVVAAVAAMLMGTSVLAADRKYETRQVWNGRGFVTHLVPAPSPTAPHALTGEIKKAKEPVRSVKTLRVGSRIVAVIPDRR